MVEIASTISDNEIMQHVFAVGDILISCVI